MQNEKQQWGLTQQLLSAMSIDVIFGEGKKLHNKYEKKYLLSDIIFTEKNNLLTGSARAKSHISNHFVLGT